MLRFVVASLIALPLLEIAGFVMVGRLIGTLPVLGLVVLSAVIGLLIIRFRGLTLPLKLRAAMERGEMPGRQMADGGLTVLAGALLVIPGFFSDIVGLLLLIPLVRGLIYNFVRARVNVVTATAGAGFVHTEEQIRPRGTIELESDQWRDRPDS